MASSAAWSTEAGFGALTGSTTGRTAGRGRLRAASRADAGSSDSMAVSGSPANNWRSLPASSWARVARSAWAWTMRAWVLRSSASRAGLGLLGAGAGSG
ncbi:hypothetical protein D3C84_875210 [compost metagenome]